MGHRCDACTCRSSLLRLPQQRNGVAVVREDRAADPQIAANLLRGTQASYLAEAGLEDAFNVFRVTPSLLSTSVPTAWTAVPGLAGPGAALAGVGGYTVQYRAAGTDTVQVVAAAASATGSVGGRARRTLRALFSTNFVSLDAVRTKETLLISGSPEIRGGCGTVHSNHDLVVSGSPSVLKNATASRAYPVTGHPFVGGTAGGGQSPKPIPPIDPARFLAAAQAKGITPIFRMTSDGRVLDAAGNVLTTLAAGQHYNGWRYSPAGPVQWELSGNTGYDGTYHLEGNAKVSGNTGSPSARWNATILATGDLEVAGNAEMSPHLTDTLFVAGRDLKVSGNPASGFTGLLAAHEQIQLSGNPTVLGYVIAEDGGNTSATVTQDTITGNAMITYGCGLNPPLYVPLSIVAWGM